MNTKKEILREALLQILDANRTRFGLQATALAVHLRGLSVRATEEQIMEALDYLSEREPAFIEETRPELNRDNRSWRITKEGIRYADERGF